MIPESGSKSFSPMEASSKCGYTLEAKLAEDVKTEPVLHQRNLKARRFNSAAIFLVFSIWLVISDNPLKQKLINLIKWRGLTRECFLWNICDGKSVLPPHFVPPTCVKDSDWTTVEAGSSTRHGAGSELLPEYEYHTALNIPLPTKEFSTISFNSHGSQSGGYFSIMTSLSQPKDMITFNISRRYTPEVGSFSRICLHPESARSYGHYLWIATPYNPLARALAEVVEEGRPHFFETTMILPELENGSEPLRIPSLRTSLVDTAQKIGDIGSKVFFDYISLNSETPSSINAVSLSGRSINIYSNGGPIVAKVNSTEILWLKTSKAPIKVDIHLYGQDSIKENNSPSVFSVSAETTNSSIEVEFKAAPVGSILAAKVSTSNSPEKVIAPPTYEGALHLPTTSGEIKIEDTRPDDPNGQARPRHIQYNKIENSALDGVTFWEESDIYPYGVPMPRSSDSFPIAINGRSITISTVQSPVTLVL